MKDTNNKQNKSELEKFSIFYEHVNDKRPLARRRTPKHLNK